MEKQKRGEVSPEMRSRLLTNRHGKLTGSQWKDMVMQPLVTLLLLIAPLVVALGPRLLAFTVRGLWFVFLVTALVLFVPLIFRARRYALAPVQFAVLSASGGRPRWMFWRSQVFQTKTDEVMRFNKRLAPHLPLKRGHDYLIYYLKDPGSLVLLSIAPADHPEAERWQPSDSFDLRHARRNG